jgi:hypothetical protein
MKGIAPAVYLAATLVIAGPLLAPGFVFALDHGMGPRVADFYARYVTGNDDPIQNKGAYAILLAGLTALAPAWAVQKLILFAPFFLAGYGAHQLAARRVGLPAALYMLSPFAYVRGVAGQTGVLWAYALAPWFLLAWLRALDGSRRAFAAAALLAFATGVFQAHGLVLLAILVAILALARLVRDRAGWRAHLGRPALLAGALLLLNAAWIVPVLLAPHTTLDDIGPADRAYFQTSASGMPSVGVAALTLQGFWRPGYESPFPSLALLVVPAALLLLSVHGLRARRDDASVSLAIAGVLGFALAVGSSSPLGTAAWDHVPLLKGFRDSQKFLALLALAYADLGAAGADAMLSRLRAPRMPRAAPALAVALLLAMPLATAAPLAGGYHGQLGAAQYPPEWQAAEDATRGCTGSMLALPWHLYLDVSWLPNRDKRVTDPAKLFFSCPLVASDDVEAGGSAGKAGTPLDAFAAYWLDDMGLASGNPRGIRTFGNVLSAANVEYVLVLKEADWRAQSKALADQRDLSLVLDNARVQVWRNLAAGPALRAVDAAVPVRDWSDLLPLSEQRPLANVAFVPPGTPTDARGLVLFTPPATRRATGWTMDGAGPRVVSLGISPVFAASADAAPSRAGPVREATALWIVALVSLVGIALLAALPRVEESSWLDRHEPRWRFDRWLAKLGPK